MVEEITAGMMKDIDEYIQELRKEGYTATYENLMSDASGFMAVVYVNDKIHAYWDGDMCGQMVRGVETPLSDIDVSKTEKNAIEVYFSDLCESKQQEIIKAAGVNSKRELDSEAHPLVVIRYL